MLFRSTQINDKISGTHSFIFNRGSSIDGDDEIISIKTEILYVNTTNGQFSIECGNIIYGDVVYGSEGTNASINLGSPVGHPSGSPIAGEKRVVAAFHTHTPLSHLSNNGNSRDVGFSSPGGDVAFFDKYQIPLILYDYIGIGEILYTGHHIDDPAKLYFYSSESCRAKTFLY